MQRTGENFWRLPCTDDYKDVIKSQIADIMNTGGSRWGGRHMLPLAPFGRFPASS